MATRRHACCLVGCCRGHLRIRPATAEEIIDAELR